MTFQPGGAIGTPSTTSVLIHAGESVLPAAPVRLLERVAVDQLLERTHRRHDVEPVVLVDQQAPNLLELVGRQVHAVGRRIWSLVHRQDGTP